MKIHSYTDIPKLGEQSHLIDCDILIKNQCHLNDADYFFFNKIVYIENQDPKLNEFDQKLSQICELLPKWKDNKSKHIFLMGGGSDIKLKAIQGAIVFRHSCHIDDNDLVYPYFTNDELKTFKYIKSVTNCDYACSFMGCLNTNSIRDQLEDALSAMSAATYFESNPQYFEFLPNDIKNEQQKKYRTLINNSIFVLCPRGYGLNSLRFFETLSFGRIPVLISDNAKLPLEKTIDYSKIIIRLPEKEIHLLPQYIDKFMNENDMKEASKLARATWSRYFRISEFDTFMQVALREII